MSASASSSPDSRFAPLRAGMALAVVGALLLTLLGRVYYLQTTQRDRILDRAQRQQQMTEPLVARRGSIFDSTGQLLAGSVQTLTLFVDPKEIIEAYDGRAQGTLKLEADLQKLAALLERDPFELIQQIGDAYPKRYVEIFPAIGDKLYAEVRKLDIPGVGVTTANQRVYPMGSLAAHVLGGVGADGKGLEGLELTCNTVLSGADGFKRSLKDSRRRAIGTLSEDYQPAEHGQHLVLTIDANIQLIAEQELAATCKQFDAKSGECVVMDPQTGAIVALANYPTFAPQYIEDSLPAQRTNRALVFPYEPGSTIKPFLVSRALDNKTVRLADVFTLGGRTWKTPYGRTITDVHGYDRLAMWDVLVKSSNIGMSQLAERMGNPELSAALKTFGFGGKSGIDLPGEETGVVHPLKKWGKASTESIAQGYELLVTPLQMARAMSAIANGGKLVTPRLVRGILEKDGDIAPTPGTKTTTLQARSVDAETAAQVRRVLADIPVRGTATKARSDVYNIFGKTGTAHRAVNGRYNQDNYTSSFVGGAPYESPRLVVAFVIHDPDRSKAHYGGIVAAPGASHILERALTYLQVPPSPPLDLPAPHIAALLHDFNPRAYEKKPAMAQTE
jgi:cell division protein FtsI/penicillin-binding protein 2